MVIRLLTKMVKYGHKIEERVKAMKSEIKENVQGTNSDGKETGTKINSVGQKEERNIQPEKNEETRIQKKEEWLRNSKISLNIPTFESQGCQKKKRKSKKLKIY